MTKIVDDTGCLNRVAFKRYKSEVLGANHYLRRKMPGYTSPPEVHVRRRDGGELRADMDEDGRVLMPSAPVVGCPDSLERTHLGYVVTHEFAHWYDLSTLRPQAPCTRGIRVSVLWAEYVAERFSKMNESPPTTRNLTSGLYDMVHFKAHYDEVGDAFYSWAVKVKNLHPALRIFVPDLHLLRQGAVLSEMFDKYPTQTPDYEGFEKYLDFLVDQGVEDYSPERGVP